MSALTCENASFADVLSACGRSDFVGTYHADGYAASDAKQTERERVLDFILGQYPEEHRTVRLLSMPGQDWTFERMLLAERKHAHMVGVERSFSVFARARRAMPTNLRTTEAMHETVSGFLHVQDRVLPYGTGDFTYAKIRARRSGDKRGRSHRLLLMDLATYTSALATDYRASLVERSEFAIKFCQRNAAWLDFTGTLCAGTEAALSNLHFVLDPYARQIPVVVTVRNGRDRFRGAGNRIARIAELVQGFKAVDSWTYVGKGGVSMLTVCGVVQQATA